MRRLFVPTPRNGPCTRAFLLSENCPNGILERATGADLGWPQGFVVILKNARPLTTCRTTQSATYLRDGSARSSSRNGDGGVTDMNVARPPVRNINGWTVAALTAMASIACAVHA